MPRTTHLAPHIVQTPGVRGGRPYVEGKGVAVDHVAVWHERMRMSADDIADQYDLTLAEIHAALAFYFDHREETDARIDAEDREFDELKRQSRSLLAEKLGLTGA